MSADRELTRTISAWFEADAPTGLPDRVLSATFERTRGTRQQRGWPALLGRTHVNRSMLALAGAAAVALLIAGAILLRVTTPPDDVGQPTAAPSPSAVASQGANGPFTGQVAFTRNVDGNADVYLMNLDGTGLVRLTTDPAEDFAASWSPDGKKLLITRRTSTEPNVDAELAFRKMAEGRGAPLRTAIARAVERGELGEPPDLSLVGDLVEGPMMHRRMLGRQPLTSDYLNAIVELVHGVLTGTTVAR